MQLAAAAAPKVKSESTTITLSIGRRHYSGKSGAGHAEMDALHNFVETCGESKEEAFAEAKRILTSGLTLKVSCTAKEVCGSCTMVLQALQFEEGANTQYSNEKSGGVSWGSSKLVQEFLEYMGLGDVFAAAVKAGAK